MRVWCRKLTQVTLLMLGLVCLSVEASPRVATQGYLLIDEYVDRHPEQRALTTQFAAQVQAPAEPLATPPERTIRIAVVYPGQQVSGYWRRSDMALARRLERLDIPFEIKAFFSRPGEDLDLQEQQLADALAWQPDYLAFTLDALPHRRMIERILAKQQTRLILQNITTPLADWQQTPPFLYVGFDHVEGTKLLAERMFEIIDYHGKYLMLYAAQGYVSEMRGGTFEAAADAHPGIEQVEAFYTYADAHRAYRATQVALKQHPDLKMIFASATDTALGALRALREADRLDVLINGWGGGKAELAALQQGELDLTVMRMNDDSGIAMAEAIKLDLMQASSQVPHIFSGRIELVEHSVSPGVLEHLERRAFRLSDLAIKEESEEKRVDEGDVKSDEEGSGDLEGDHDLEEDGDMNKHANRRVTNSDNQEGVDPGVLK